MILRLLLCDVGGVRNIVAESGLVLTNVVYFNLLPFHNKARAHANSRFSQLLINSVQNSPKEQRRHHSEKQPSERCSWRVPSLLCPPEACSKNYEKPSGPLFD